MRELLWPWSAPQIMSSALLLVSNQGIVIAGWKAPEILLCLFPTKNSIVILLRDF